VGDGPERASLESLARELDIAGRVTWHGWRSKEEVAALYRCASCLVNPSKYEGLPNTVLEAMASGLPVVASDVGGNNDLVVPGATGYLFELTQPDALTTALRALADDPAGAQAMGKRAREVAVASYSWQGVATRYLELLSQ
jgi:glycosyltransferase involved in cell wall biosynthesis